MADWRLDQKTEETPQGTDLSLLVRGTSVFKTTFQKIKDFIIGTTSMGTEATDVTGAIKEVNDKVGDINVEEDGTVATQLNERALKTYVTLEQLGITANTDIISIINAMPVYSMLVMDVRNTITITNTLPYSYSTLTIVKCNSSRNFIRLMSVDGREWISSYNVSGGTLGDWQQVATISQVTTMLEAYQLKTV